MRATSPSQDRGCCPGRGLGWGLLLGLLIPAVWYAGPGCRKDGPAVVGQDTPRNTLRKLQKAAAVEANRADFVECWRCPSEGERRLMENEFDFMRAVYELYDALISSYGEHAVREFRETKGDDGSVSNFGVFPRASNWADEVVIARDGDKARVTWTLDTGSKQTMMMLQEDGIWRIDIRAALGGTDAGQMAPVYKA